MQQITDTMVCPDCKRRVAARVITEAGHLKMQAFCTNQDCSKFHTPVDPIDTAIPMASINPICRHCNGITERLPDDPSFVRRFRCINPDCAHHREIVISIPVSRSDDPRMMRPVPNVRQRPE